MKYYFYNFLCNFIFCALVLAVQFAPTKVTMLNNYNWQKGLATMQINEGYIKGTIAEHCDNIDFKKRKFTTKTVHILANYIPVSIGTIFIGIQFLLLFLCGCIIYQWSFVLFCNSGIAILSSFLFYTSFHILFIFYYTNYSFDEPFQYFLLLSSFYLLFINKNFMAFSLCFILAVLCKETSLLFLPAICYLMKLNNMPTKKILFIVGSSCIVYIAYLFAIHNFWLQHHNAPSLTSRFSLFTTFNFVDVAKSIESIGSILLALFTACFLFSVNANLYQQIKLAFYTTVIINTLVVLIFAYARETRLLCLPMLLVYPYLGKLFYNTLHWKSWRKVTYIHGLAILANIACFAFIYHYIIHHYTTSIQPNYVNYNQSYLIFIIICLQLLSIKKIFSK